MSSTPIEDGIWLDSLRKRLQTKRCFFNSDV